MTSETGAESSMGRAAGIRVGMALALAIGLSASMAGSAFAQQEGGGNNGSDHVDVVEVQASCNVDGTQSASWVITNTSDEHTAQISDLSSTIGPLTGAAIGDTIAPGASETVTLVTSGDTTGTVHLSVELEFVNNTRERRGNDDVVFSGGCKAVPPETITVTVPGPTVLVQVPTPAPAVAVAAAARFTG